MEVLTLVAHVNSWEPANDKHSKISRGKWGKADHRGKVNHPPFCSYEKC